MGRRALASARRPIRPRTKHPPRSEEVIELLGLDWPDLMPGWEQRTAAWDDEDEPRTRTFEDDVRFLSDLQDTAYARSSPIVRARTFAGYPVRAAGAPPASLYAFFGGDVELRPGQTELLRVLGRAAAVEGSRRLADEQRVKGLAQLECAMERTVATLSSALGARDPYTTGHEARVAALATAIGPETGLSGEELRLLDLAATVHDIGKIVVPPEFLSKPTRLSQAEFAVIKQHCRAGDDLLQPAALPDRVMDAVLQHHERLDGSGYPQGPGGDEIGVFGRILAVADVTEAMSSDRPYRPALGVEPALAEIERGRGTLFDPAACDACLSLFREQAFGFLQEAALSGPARAP